MHKKSVMWRYICHLILCGLSVPLLGQENSSSPSINQQEYLINLGKTFVAILNTPDDKLAEQYAYETYIPEKAEGLAALLRNGFGEVELGKIRIMGNGGSIHIIAKAKRTGEWHNFQVGLTEEIPKKGTRLFIASAVTPVLIPDGRMEEAPVVEKLKEYISDLKEQEDLSGSLMILKDKNILIHEAFGLANVELGIKNTTSTPQNMGSGNKMFTAIAIAQLVEVGKLRYEDPVSKHLPDYPDQEFAQKAALHHLLSHTSGLTDYWDNEYEKYWNDISTLEEVIPFIVNKEKTFKPGEGGYYSNSGFVLLGLIIERVSDMKYVDYVQKNIIEKVSMKHTGFFRMDGTDRPIAHGYEMRGNGWTIARHGRQGGPAGGAFTTPADMAKFADAFMNHRILDVDATKKLTTLRSQLSFGTQYGYGFIVDDKSIGHGGMGPGIYFEFKVFSEMGYTYILCLNNESPAGSELLFTIEEILARP